MDVFVPLFAIGAIALVLGFIPALIADSKGHDFVGWWLFGTFFFIIALPCALLIGSKEKTKKRGEGFKQCEFCAELIRIEAKLCRHCGRDVDELDLKAYEPRE
jgi:hypothetical protein